MLMRLGNCALINRNRLKYINPIHFLQKLQGLVLEYRLKKRKKPIVFKDWAGNLYWQYPDDDFRSSWNRKSVTDSISIVRYMLDNVKPGWVCIDIGAHIGGVSVPLWKKVGCAGKVISVDADPGNIGKIKANLRLNNCPTEYVVNLAITNKKGIVQLRRYIGADGWQTIGNPSFIQGYKSIVINVPSANFEELAETYGLKSFDFVKIDVEGAEILVLSGMRSFLKEKRIGCIVFEVNYLTLEGTGNTVSELMGFWDDLDYELWRLNEKDIPVSIDGDRPNNLVWDCIALVRT